MNFYIASGRQNKETVRRVSRRLTEQGFHLTYDWTKHGHVNSHSELQAIGLAERDAVLTSSFLIVLLPAGKGSHVEMGIALGQGKPVFLYSLDADVLDSEQTSTFYHLPDVTVVIGSLDDLLAQVTAAFNAH